MVHSYKRYLKRDHGEEKVENLCIILFKLEQNPDSLNCVKSSEYVWRELPFLSTSVKVQIFSICR